LEISYFSSISIISFRILDGVLKLKLPKFYYIYYTNNILDIILFNKSSFKAVLSSILNSLNCFTLVKFIKLRLRGLGYEIRSCSDKIHSFCFNWINYIYLFLPLTIILKAYKKRFIMLSKFWYVLKIILDQLLDLKRVGPYELRGMRLPRTIILIKKTRKKV